jgi:hypothetical protein
MMLTGSPPQCEMYERKDEFGPRAIQEGAQWRRMPTIPPRSGGVSLAVNAFATKTVASEDFSRARLERADARGAKLADGGLCP